MNKVIDKIITSVHEPDNTKVVWHNPETGELKIFGNSGWELAGGSKLPEIIESGWVLDKETGGIAAKYKLDFPNILKYGGNPGPPSWWFSGSTDLEVGQVIQVVDGDGNSITITVLSKSYYGIPVYSFDGDLDTSKVYSYGTYEFNVSNTASGLKSVASGNGCIASGECSHSEGHVCTGVGYASHAEGINTIANGMYSHAEGWNTIASGSASHAEGFHTTALSNNQHVQGKYNIEDPDYVYQFIIGNGDDVLPSNAFAVKWDGTIVLWKDVNTPLELTPSKLEKLLALVD